jgi:hypothetical protein
MGNGGDFVGEPEREGGTVEKGGSGTTSPVDATVMMVDAQRSEDPVDANEAATGASCSEHPASGTFTPSGATSAHCYWAHTEKSTWQDAVDTCKREGGHLATVRSAAENQFVIGLIENLGTDLIWLGGTDDKTPDDASGGGPYMWITGEPFDYAPWAKDNPDGACDSTCNGQKCQCQHRVCVDKAGAFWDRYEDRLYDWVCESP